MDTSCFKPISLDQMSGVKLMDRIDLKYWFRADQLQDILYCLHDEYYVMEIEQASLLPYYSQYFDTGDDDMYLCHHNGRPNRYKIRRRVYLSSGIGFLEIKLKTAKGRTVKNRIPSVSAGAQFSQVEYDFIRARTPYRPEMLVACLSNEYSRITLVSKDLNERCTIDLQLKFGSAISEVSLPSLAIVEIKADSAGKSSPMVRALRERHVQPSGFSKYCIGRNLTDSGLKSNAFKPKLRELAKLCNQL